MRIPRRSLFIAAASLVSLAGVASFVAPSALAQTAKQQQRPSVVRVINLNTILDTLDEKTDRERELQKFLQGLEDNVNGIKKQLDQSRKEMELLPAKGPAFSAKREEVLRLAARYQAEGQTAKLLAEDKKKLMQIDLFEKMSDAVAEYAKSEGIDVVLNDDSAEKVPDNAPAQQTMSAMASRRVLFAAHEIDISDEVAQRMNNAYKLAGASGGAGGGAAKPAGAAANPPAAATPPAGKPANPGH